MFFYHSLFWSTNVQISSHPLFALTRYKIPFSLGISKTLFGINYIAFRITFSTIIIFASSCSFRGTGKVLASHQLQKKQLCSMSNTIWTIWTKKVCTNISWSLTISGHPKPAYSWDNKCYLSPNNSVITAPKSLGRVMNAGLGRLLSVWNYIILSLL